MINNKTKSLLLFVLCAVGAILFTLHRDLQGAKFNKKNIVMPHVHNIVKSSINNGSVRFVKNEDINYSGVNVNVSKKTILIRDSVSHYYFSQNLCFNSSNAISFAYNFAKNIVADYSGDLSSKIYIIDNGIASLFLVYSLLQNGFADIIFVTEQNIAGITEYQSTEKIDVYDIINNFNDLNLQTATSSNDHDDNIVRISPKATDKHFTIAKGGVKTKGYIDATLPIRSDKIIQLLLNKLQQQGLIIQKVSNIEKFTNSYSKKNSASLSDLIKIERSNNFSEQIVVGIGRSSECFTSYRFTEFKVDGSSFGDKFVKNSIFLDDSFYVQFINDQENLIMRLGSVSSLSDIANRKADDAKFLEPLRHFYQYLNINNTQQADYVCSQVSNIYHAQNI